jgi:hypothetical protein
MSSPRQALAFATAILAFPLFIFAQQMTSSSGQEASSMKPVSATLLHALDSAKDQQGYTFEAKLDQKVVLANGTELPRNTVLVGKVAQDDMQQQGISKLALRFDKAELKNGKIVPVHASIVGYYSPGSLETDMSATQGMTEVPNDWTSKTLALDQVNVLHGVDLHSRIGSSNSGVFVSTRKDDVKLPAGSELQFAIGPAQTS